MNRRTAFCQMAATVASASAALVPLAACAQSPGPASDGTAPLSAPWQAWKAAYLTDEGRIVDGLQGGASHSESQGYGLALAALFADDAAFDRIYAWTEANLAIRGDALLAWRWFPRDSGVVPDRNNASDGDLFYAWALVIRGTRDANPAMIDRASAIARTLVTTCVRPAPDGSARLLFMPAVQGFEDEAGALTINPSYYMPRAMRDVARVTGASDLAIAAADGEALIGDLARAGLTPDWVKVQAGGMVIPGDRPDRNGYEAIRVALFLLWSGNTGHPALVRQAQAYQRANAAGRMTSGDHVTVFDRVSGDVLETSRHVGYGAVAALVSCSVARDRGAPIPVFRTDDQAYYPATLHLMTLIAQITSAPECMPI